MYIIIETNKQTYCESTEWQKEAKKEPATPGIPTRSPIEVLTRPYAA